MNVSIPDLCTLSYFVCVIVLWLFLTKPWVSLHGVILVFHDHINLPFRLNNTTLIFAHMGDFLR